MIRKIINKYIFKKSIYDQELQYLLDNGLTLGKNVSNYSPYAFDSEYP